MCIVEKFKALEEENRQLHTSFSKSRYEDLFIFLNVILPLCQAEFVNEPFDHQETLTTIDNRVRSKFEQICCLF